MEFLDGFSEISNAILNRAKEIANEDGCSAIYTIHAILALYEEPDIAEGLRLVTGVSAQEFTGAYMDLVENQKIKTSREPIELSIRQNTHREWTSCLNELYDIHKRLRVEMDLNALMRSIISNNTYAHELYIALGVPEQTLKQLTLIEYKYLPLLQFCKNLNLAVSKPNAGLVVGRDSDVQKVIETLGRRVKNNPLLIGDAGVGKTAIVELLARRLIKNEGIPKYLEGKVIFEVDASSLVGGSQYRGMFEARIKELVNAASRAGNVILFFDEFHTIMKLGGSSENDMTAANILKPMLARSGISVIGATTTKEYSKSIESDEAFNRRFETIMIDEPSDDDTVKILDEAVGVYEEYHHALVSHEVIEYAVKLSSRYMTDKKQPDKALTVIDQTCAHMKACAKDSSKEFIVTKDEIRDTVARITNIEISDLSLDELQKLSKLEDKLKESVIGQDDAVKSVSDAIKRSKVGFGSHDKPIGTFLFVGPTGVGKTELCKRLSDEFSGRKNNLIRLDMSEYMEKHSVSRMIGSPPGYVGYESGGQLTDAVSRNPYSVILFDEIEKAHPDVFNIMLQILDDGRLTDSHGKVVDFRNTIIIMTSNAGYGIDSDKVSVGFATDDSKNKVSEDKAKKALQKTFKPEFLNRLDKIVVFNSLSKEDNKQIVDIMLKQLKERCRENSVTLQFDDSAVEDIIKNGFDAKFGARNLRRYIQNTVETMLTDKFIEGSLIADKTYKVSVNDSGEYRVEEVFGPNSIDDTVKMNLLAKCSSLFDKAEVK